MTVTHFLYIPVVALLGVAIGYVLGARAVRAELRQQREQLRK